MSILGALVVPPWISVPAKIAGGVLKAIPWQAYVVAALLALVAYYGHVREDRGEASGRAAQAKHDAPIIASLEEQLRLVREAGARAAALDAAAHATQAAKMATAKTTFDKEKADALAGKDRLIADLRAGAQQLRIEWQGCAAGSAGSGGTDAGFGPSLGDAAAEARREGAGSLIADADLADAEVSYLQALIRSAPRCFIVVPD